MTKRERIQAVIHGKPVDRTPVSFWRHYPDIDHDPDRLAEAILRDHREFDLDFVKMMPSGMYGVEDWGCEVGNPDPDLGFKRLLAGPIRRLEDWRSITPRQADAGARGRELRCLRMVRSALGPDVSILQTVFSPLTGAAKLAGRETLLAHLRADEPAVRPALEVITATEEAYIAASFAHGASGIFLATQFAGDGLLTYEEHQRWCAPFEARLLRAIHGRSELSLMHLHGQRIHLDRFVAYPVPALSWEDTAISPAEGRARFPGVVVGGLDRMGWVLSASLAEVREQTAQLERAMGRERFILAPGCVMALRTPRENLKAIREAVA
jgi:uroporphyrinogen decarboxylase